MTSIDPSASARPDRRRIRPSRLAIGALAGAALVIGAPLAANAHVGVSPENPAAGAATELSFGFGHGCDGSPTTALRVQIPEGVTNVQPVWQAGWTAEADTAENGTVTAVTYTADSAIPDGQRASVALQARFADDAEGTSYAFGVVQSCESGETAWVEEAAEGEDPHDLEAPAPVVTVGAALADAGGHGHGDAAGDHGDGDHGEHGDGEHADASADGAASAEAANADSAIPIAALVTGIGGAVLGAVALIVAVFAATRRRS